MEWSQNLRLNGALFVPAALAPMIGGVIEVFRDTGVYVCHRNFSFCSVRPVKTGGAFAPAIGAVGDLCREK